MDDIIYTKDYERLPENYKFVNVEDISSILNEKVGGICIYDSDMYIVNNKKIVAAVTDSNNPLILKKDIFSDNYILNINSEYYKKK